MLVFFHMLICHLYIFSGEVQILRLCSKRVIYVFSISNFQSSLCFSMFSLSSSYPLGPCYPCCPCLLASASSRAQNTWNVPSPHTLTPRLRRDEGSSPIVSSGNLTASPGAMRGSARAQPGCVHPLLDIPRPPVNFACPS